MQVILKGAIVAKKKNITVSSTLGLLIEIVVVIETENKKLRVEIIGRTMPQLPLGGFRTEAASEVDLLLRETILEINCHHQVANTTGVNTLRFVLPLLQRGLEAMEVQQHWALIETFVEEVVNTEVQERQDRLLITRHLPDHPKVATVAVVTTIIEATGTEILFNRVGVRECRGSVCIPKIFVLVVSLPLDKVAEKYIYIYSSGVHRKALAKFMKAKT